MSQSRRLRFHAFCVSNDRDGATAAHGGQRMEMAPSQTPAGPSWAPAVPNPHKSGHEFLGLTSQLCLQPMRRVPSAHDAEKAPGKVERDPGSGSARGPDSKDTGAGRHRVAGETQGDPGMGGNVEVTASAPAHRPLCGPSLSALCLWLCPRGSPATTVPSRPSGAAGEET